MITITLNGVIIGGCGSDYVLSEANISGLGMPDVNAINIDRHGAHGIAASRDFLTFRTIGIPVLVYRKNDPAAALAAARALNAAWQPTREGIEDILTVESDGIGPENDKMTFFGRPRGGLELDLNKHHSGLITAYGSFVCLDPLGYGDEVTDGGTLFTADNVGTAATDRISIVVTGNGGTPVITNVTDESRAIRFGTTLAGGATRQIDVRTKTVMNGSADRYVDLSPTNQWFDLLPGENSIVVTGAASIDITWRPAWY